MKNRVETVDYTAYRECYGNISKYV